MLTPRAARCGAAQIALSAALALGLSGCWLGEVDLLEGEPNYSLESFYGTGQKVFQSGDSLLIFEISSTDTRFRMSTGEGWQPISHIRKIEEDPPGHYVAVLPVGANTQAYYMPFVYRKDGFTIPRGTGTAETKQDLIAKARAAYREQKIVTWRLLSPEEAVIALHRAGGKKDGSKGKPESTAEPEVSSFRSDGYLYPDLFEAIYQGDTGDFSAESVAFYLQNFALMFRNAGDDRSCNAVITAPAISALTMKASADTLGMMFGPLFDAHKAGSSGRDEAFGDGFNAGEKGVGSLLQAQARGESDAKLFYSRHRCVTPTAARFFANFNRFAVGN